jgi:hypothetical protein
MIGNKKKPDNEFIQGLGEFLIGLCPYFHACVGRLHLEESGEGAETRE